MTIKSKTASEIETASTEGLTPKTMMARRESLDRAASDSTGAILNGYDGFLEEIETSLSRNANKDVARRCCTKSFEL
mgnify:CR=1 FL=1